MTKIQYRKRGNKWWFEFSYNKKRVRESSRQEDYNLAVTVAEKFLASLRLKDEHKKMQQAAADKPAGDSAPSAPSAAKRVQVKPSAELTELLEKPVSFEDAWKFIYTYPGKKNGEKHKSTLQSVWNDFASFARQKCGIESVGLVSSHEARLYMAHLQTSGRFTPIVYMRAGKLITNMKTVEALSGGTYNFYLKTLKKQFKLLIYGKFCLTNPFTEFENLPVRQVPRKPFTPAMLRQQAQHEHMCRPIVIVGAYSALREKDICMLRVKNVRFEENWLRGLQYKTKIPYHVPMKRKLAEYLKTQIKQDARPDDFVFPELAREYAKASSKISKAYKELLALAGIQETSVLIEGREHRSSIYDAHSLRHTFGSRYSRYLPPHYIKYLMGHVAKNDVTERYLHVDETALYNDFMALPDPFEDEPDSRDNLPRISHNERKIIEMLLSAKPEDLPGLQRQLAALIA